MKSPSKSQPPMPPSARPGVCDCCARRVTPPPPRTSRPAAATKTAPQRGCAGWQIAEFRTYHRGTRAAPSQASPADYGHQSDTHACGTYGPRCARPGAAPVTAEPRWIPVGVFRGKKLDSAARWRGGDGFNPAAKRFGLAALISFSAEKPPLPAPCDPAQRLLGDEVFPRKNCRSCDALGRVVRPVAESHSSNIRTTTQRHSPLPRRYHRRARECRELSRS
ncbi:hypothetical protein MCEMIE22_03214 [Mycobacteriaceae bacterium]